MSTSEEKTVEDNVSTPPLLPFLPQDVLVLILSKLPAKSLVRLRCVSKFFCALRADHAFGVLHRSFSLTLPSRAGILIAIMPGKPLSAPAYYTINFSEENPRRPEMIQANRLGYLDAEPFRKGSLHSSSDGLICLSRPNGDFVVCNVSTGQRISLPTFQYHSLPSSTYALLGFDSQSKRYKVLMSAYRRSRRKGSEQIYYEYKHWILTVGVDKSWREINYSSHPFDPFDGYGIPGYSDSYVYIDGFTYFYNWLTSDDPPSFQIVAFEVASESYSFIPLPAEVSSSSQIHPLDVFGETHHYSNFVFRNFALLQVDGGRLAILYVHKIGRVFHMDVWTWEKSKQCWVKITMPIPLETINGVKYLSYTSNHAGEIVFLCTNRKQFSILVCNLKSEVWRKFDVGGIMEVPFCFTRDVRMCKIMDNVFSIE